MGMTNACCSLQERANVIVPQNTAELQAIVRKCTDAGTPINIYNSWSEEGVQLQLTAMNHILEIDTANLVATVEPGLKLKDLAIALEGKGLRFVPADTPYYQDKTVGEFFYQGCPNISSLKYGFAKHFIMGTEIILGSGEILKTGGKTVKNVTGYDLTRFMNGPGCTFGITIKYLLKLLPKPEMKRLFAIKLADLDKVFHFIDSLREAHIVPSYLLWFDVQTRLALQEAGAQQLVILELDGIMEDVNGQGDVITTLVRQQGGELAEEGRLVEKIAKLFALSPSHLLADEYKFLYTQQRSFIEKAMQEVGGVGLFGQLAEGKINVYSSASAAEQVSVHNQLFDLASRCGGTITGKKRRLSGQEFTGRLAEAEAALKRQFDPAGIIRG